MRQRVLCKHELQYCRHIKIQKSFTSLILTFKYVSETTTCHFENLVDLIYRKELNREPLDKECKLNVHKTSREGSFLNYYKTSNPHIEIKTLQRQMK